MTTETKNHEPEEVCSSCGAETFWSECHYCKVCDAALCPDCQCDKHDEEKDLPRFKEHEKSED